MATRQVPLLRETFEDASVRSASAQVSPSGPPMLLAEHLRHVTLRFSTTWIASAGCSDINRRRCSGSTTTRQSQKRAAQFWEMQPPKRGGTSSSSLREHLRDPRPGSEMTCGWFKNTMRSSCPRMKILRRRSALGSDSRACRGTRGLALTN